MGGGRPAAPHGPRRLPGRMTVKLGDGGGDEGLRRLGKRSADEDALDGEGPGAAAARDGGTKRDAETPRDGGGGPPAPAGGPPAPSPPPACPQDQHHFLRSSVRPQSKRPRKDASCAGGGGPGPRGKGTATPSPSRARALRGLPPCAGGAPPSGGGAGVPEVGVPGGSPGSRWRAGVGARRARVPCLRPDPGGPGVGAAVTRRVASGASPSASSPPDSEV